MLLPKLSSPIEQPIAWISEMRRTISAKFRSAAASVISKHRAAGGSRCCAKYSRTAGTRSGSFSDETLRLIEHRGRSRSGWSRCRRPRTASGWRPATGGRLRQGEMDAIASGALGGVARGGGGAQDAGRASARRGDRDEADADAQGKALLLPHVAEVFDRAPELPGDFFRAGQRTAF